MGGRQEARGSSGHRVYVGGYPSFIDPPWINSAATSLICPRLDMCLFSLVWLTVQAGAHKQHAWVWA